MAISELAPRSEINEEEWQARIDLAALYRIFGVFRSRLGKADRIYTAQIAGGISHRESLVTKITFLSTVTAKCLMRSPPLACSRSTWTKKHGKSHYGYKNHVNVDRRHKLVRRYHVSDAAEHDSQVLDDILDGDNTALGVWADSAYRSAEIEASLKEKGLRSRIHRKGRRNKPLSEREKQGNKTRSSTAMPLLALDQLAGIEAVTGRPDRHVQQGWFYHSQRDPFRSARNRLRRSFAYKSKHRSRGTEAGTPAN